MVPLPLSIPQMALPSPLLFNNRSRLLAVLPLQLLIIYLKSAACSFASVSYTFSTHHITGAHAAYVSMAFTFASS